VTSSIYLQTSANFYTIVKVSAQRTKPSTYLIPSYPLEGMVILTLDKSGLLRIDQWAVICGSCIVLARLSMVFIVLGKKNKFMYYTHSTVRFSLLHSLT